jgi:hypothetical protein
MSVCVSCVRSSREFRGPESCAQPCVAIVLDSLFFWSVVMNTMIQVGEIARSHGSSGCAIAEP